MQESASARLTDPTEPRVRLGRFELDKLIGCGGMGIVFRAHDPELARPVALKLWNLDAEQAALALRHEAQCQAQVSHPNVVTIYETGKIGDDTYLAMEFIDGRDVRRWLQTRALMWQELLALFVCAGKGLAAVHARGLVHGDFKPENILLGRDGRVLVADFGVARAVQEVETGADERGPMGTRIYMAPERLHGHRGNAASDQFSFCVALWECLHGVRPFAGINTIQLLDSMEGGRLEAGPAAALVPPSLRRVLRKGLALDPRERYTSVEVLVRELVRVPDRIRRRRRISAGLGVLGVATLVLWLTKPEERPPEAPLRAVHHELSGINPEPAPTLQVDEAEPVDAAEPAEPVDAAEPVDDAEPVDAVEPVDAAEPLDATEPLDEILARIAGDDYGGAMVLWRSEQLDAWTRSESSAELSLEIAKAMHKRALVLETADPKSALTLARLANQVATSVPLEVGTSEAAQVTAEERATATYALYTKLAEQEVAQSKHSTVPSTME